MRLSGCLKKNKVIGLLENFLDDFEKKLENFFFEKIINFQDQYDFSKFLTFIDFDDDFWLKKSLKTFFWFFHIVFAIENVLQDQGFPTHVESDA